MKEEHALFAKADLIHRYSRANELRDGALIADRTRCPSALPSASLPAGPRVASARRLRVRSTFRSMMKWGGSRNRRFASQFFRGRRGEILVASRARSVEFATGVATLPGGPLRGKQLTPCLPCT
jgi:hypothetical protein